MFGAIMKFSFRYLFLLLITLSSGFLSVSVFADETALIAHFRHRPPEMVIEHGKQFKGPLKDIIEEAASKSGFNISWFNENFDVSYECLKKGCVDIVPRLILNDERKAFTNYLGPIGRQQKNILFLVQKGKENLISKYEDLEGLLIGTKNKASYFDRFNRDDSLKKVFLKDDKNMAKMFAAKRFDTMIVIDKTAIEEALRQINFTEFAYASYQHKQSIDVYYGFSKFSPRADQYEQLQSALLEMVEKGRINEIYYSYGLKL